MVTMNSKFLKSMHAYENMTELNAHTPSPGNQFAESALWATVAKEVLWVLSAWTEQPVCAKHRAGQCGNEGSRTSVSSLISIPSRMNIQC